MVIEHSEQKTYYVRKREIDRVTTSMASCLQRRKKNSLGEGTEDDVVFIT